MPQQIISIGAAANDGTGDNHRAAFRKANENFTELYGLTGDLATADNNLQDQITALNQRTAVQFGISTGNSRANTATETPDEELFAVLAAGVTYAVEALVLYTAPTATDFKAKLSYGGTSPLRYVEYGAPAAATTGVNAFDATVRTGAAATTFGGITGSTLALHLRGTITVGAGDGGLDLSFSWAQGVSGATAATILAGSYIKATPLLA